MAQVALRNIVKTFDRTPAVQGIDLDISDREFIVLVGPSGCGKSTTLRMIAGLEEATSGEIYIGDQLVNDVPPKDRDIAMVFQNYALYPHMTVFENMSFGLRLKKFPKPEIKRAGAGRRPHSRHNRPSRPPAEAAFRRSAPARRDGARDRSQPQGLPVRRAAIEPRCQIARPDAHRDQEDPSDGHDHDGLRHARPGRGDDLGRPGGHHERRTDRSDRHAARGLSQAENPIRRRLYRLADDELPAMPARRERRRADRSALGLARSPGAGFAGGTLSATRRP